MLELRAPASGNGWKCTICLEEIGLEYDLKEVNLVALEQKQPEFLKLNPNGRAPVLIDHDNDGFVVFDSCAILVYLAEKTGKLMSDDPKLRSQTIQWLFFQSSGIGPMHGQAGVFTNYFPTKHPDVIERFRNESRRLYTVLDTVLADRTYLVGEEFSIADIASFAWSIFVGYAGIDLEGLDNLKRWQDKISERPGVQRGLKEPALPEMTEEMRETFPKMIMESIIQQ